MTEMIIAGASLVVMPWVIWVTISLFNQRQELAVLKEIFQFLKEKL